MSHQPIFATTFILNKVTASITDYLVHEDAGQVNRNSKWQHSHHCQKLPFQQTTNLSVSFTELTVKTRASTGQWVIFTEVTNAL